MDVANEKANVNSKSDLLHAHPPQTASQHKGRTTTCIGTDIGVGCKSWGAESSSMKVIPRIQG